MQGKIIRGETVCAALFGFAFAAFLLYRKDEDWKPGFAFGGLVVAINFLLLSFLLSKMEKLDANNRFRHRLALLLAFSIKVFNLLILTYLGLVALNLGAFPIVLGASFGLMMHVVFFFAVSNSKNVF